MADGMAASTGEARAERQATCFNRLHTKMPRSLLPGTQVQAHGGGMLPWAGRFYWVGEGAKPGCAPNPEGGKGCVDLKLEVSQDINLYSSDDLSSWVFEGVLVNQVTPMA